MKRISFAVTAGLILAAVIATSAQTPGLAWVGTLDGDNTRFINQVAVDNAGNVYTVGGFYGLMDADPGAGEHFISSQDQSDGFIIKTNSSGVFQDVYVIPGDEYQAVGTVNIDKDGNIIVSGTFQNTVNFDPSSGDTFEFTAPNQSSFLMKIKANGDVDWVRAFTDSDDNSSIWSVATDKSNGNIFVGGQFTQTMDADPSGSTFNLASAGLTDLWFAKFTPTGAFTSAVKVGGAGEDFFTSMVTDKNNELVTVGSFAGIVDFDPGAGTADLTSNGSNDTFILKLSNSLGHVWSRQIISSQLYSGGLGTDASANIIFNGTFDGTADFDPGAGTLTLTGVNEDFFIASYNASGNVNWAKRAGGLEGEIGTALTVDGTGNIFVAGRFYQQFDIDPDPAITDIISFEDGGFDQYVAKFSNTGTLLWYQPMPSGDIISAVYMTSDASNNFYIAGDWNGTVDFSSNTCVDGKREVQDNATAYLLKFDATATLACFGFLEQPEGNAAGCQGTEIFLSAPAGGTTHITYQWQMFNGTIWKDLNDQEFNTEPNENGYEGTKTAYLKIVPIDGAEYGDIRVMVNGDGVTTIFSNTVSFIINPTPPVPRVVATSGCGPGYYQINAVGGTYIQFQWYVDDVLVEDASGPSVNLHFDSNAIVGVSVSDHGCEGDQSLIAINTDHCSQPPGLEWVNQLSPGLIVPRAMALDTDDNIVIAGEFYQKVDFNTGVGVFELTPAGTSAHFIAKYTTGGAFLWARQTDLRIFDVSVGNTGDDIYYVGMFQNTVDVDPTGGTLNMTALTGSQDIVIVELAGDGTFEWAKQITGTSGHIGNFGRAISGGPSGEIVITGGFTGTMDFDPGVGNAPLSSASTIGPDIFVAKYDGDGNYLWAKRVGSTGQVENGYDVTVDSDGNIYTAGVFQTTVDFDPAPGGANVLNLTSAGATDAFIQCLYGDGTLRWAKRIGSTGSDEAVTISLDHSDKPVIGGHFSGSVDFDPNSGTFNLNGSSVVFKLTDLGDFQWAKAFGGDIVKVFVDPTDRVTLTGFFENIIDADPGPDVYRLQTAVTSDIYVAQLEAAGDFLWAYNTNASGREFFQNEPIEVLMDSEGSIILGGSFTHMIDVDPTNCTYAIAGEASREMFFKKIRPGLATICFSLQPVDVVQCGDGDVHLIAQGLGTTNLKYQWQYFEVVESGYRDIDNGVDFSGSKTNELIINNATAIFGSGLYRVVVSGDNAVSQLSNIVEVAVSGKPDAPTYTPTSFCSPGEKTVEVSGDSDGSYRWHDASMNEIDFAYDHDYTTSFIEETTTYYVTFFDLGCESDPVQVDVEINLTVDAPTVTGASSCLSPASVMLTANGANAGDFRWYEGPQETSAIDGLTGGTYVTPELSGTTSYYVAIVDGVCESLRTEVTATIGALAPPVSNGATICANTSTALTATASVAGDIQWYDIASGGSPLATGATFNTPALSATTVYYIMIVGMDCESDRAAVTVTVNGCTNNQPPVIAPTTSSAPVGGKASIDLSGLLSDPDNNLDLSTLTIVVQPTSGALATFENGQLVIDYTGNPFAGEDHVTIRVCDLASSCVEQVITIIVSGDILVYNAISPNGDDKNEIFYLEYIDAFEETRENRVTIYNRWGSPVFDVKNYNNSTNVFTGKNNNGNELPSGTYYYKIEFLKGNRKPETGYLSLKR